MYIVYHPLCRGSANLYIPLPPVFKGIQIHEYEYVNMYINVYLKILFNQQRKFR